ncbi:hypothetical protein AGMMS50230_01120 [Spirochaetia bacterium]|nr:hypothetical protein AGMMS50230_01120 [Spirochaetia bacterium]
MKKLVALIAALAFAGCSQSTSSDPGIIALPDIALANPSAPSIAAKFGIDVTENSAAKVTEVFTALHDYLATGPAVTGSGTALKLGAIALGDYIDLAGLTVKRYSTKLTKVITGFSLVEGQGDINLSTNPTISANNSTLLRLIVVGINAYRDKNGNGTAPPPGVPVPEPAGI